MMRAAAVQDPLDLAFVEDRPLLLGQLLPERNGFLIILSPLEMKRDFFLEGHFDPDGQVPVQGPLEDGDGPVHLPSRFEDPADTDEVQGVRLINLENEDKICSVAKAEKS